MGTTKKYVLGVDLGTSSIKSLVYYPDGTIGESFQEKNETLHPQQGFNEQDPQGLFEEVISVISKAVRAAGQPEAVSFSSAMHSVMAVDETGNPLSNLVIWSDMRSQVIAAEFKKDQKKSLLFYEHTGVPIHPMSPFFKLKWWKKNKPELFKKTAKFISLSEYIFFKLFGVYKVGYSIASTSGLFDHQTLDWYSPALEELDLSPKKFSAPVPSLHICRGLQKDWDKKTGLEKDTPFVLGGADGCMANLGSGVMNKGDMALTIGTSGAIRVFGKKPLPVSDENQGSIFNYLLTKDIFISGAAVNNGGILLDWCRHSLFKDDPELETYDDVMRLAEKSVPGAHGLLFLPYIYGERAPMWDSKTSGAFLGISYRHKKSDFVRALMEGLCFALYHNMEIMSKSLDEDIERLIASGGFTKSEAWLQMLADIFNKKIVVTDKGDASSIGAALMGMKALGMITDWQKEDLKREAVKTILPDKSRFRIYQRNFALYKSLYPLLKEKMHEQVTWQ